MGKIRTLVSLDSFLSPIPSGSSVLYFSSTSPRLCFALYLKVRLELHKMTTQVGQTCRLTILFMTSCFAWLVLWWPEHLGSLITSTTTPSEGSEKYTNDIFLAIQRVLLKSHASIFCGSALHFDFIHIDLFKNLLHVSSTIHFVIKEFKSGNCNPKRKATTCHRRQLATSDKSPLISKGDNLPHIDEAIGRYEEGEVTTCHINQTD